MWNTLFQTGGLFQDITRADFLQGLFSVLGAVLSGYLGYIISIKKINAETKNSSTQVISSAEQQFRDDLIKQLEDSSTRFDRQTARLDDREKRYNELLVQIDAYWAEKSELKSKIATQAAELLAAQRKINDLTAELEKFERKVFYIAKTPEGGGTT